MDDRSERRRAGCRRRIVGRKACHPEDAARSATRVHDEAGRRLKDLSPGDSRQPARRAPPGANGFTETPLPQATPLSNRIRAAACLALTLLTGACCCGATDGSTPPPPPPAGRPVLPATYRPTGHAAAGDAFVHLFEGRWDELGAECENVLGPAGFRAVQVSPPQEHSVQGSGTWSQRYQPVSYSVERSRSGTGVEFQAMVNRCRAAGVDIYVDAVLNHM